MSKQDQWDPSAFITSPIIHQLSGLTRHFSEYSSWPTLNDYHNIFKLKQVDITPVAQSIVIENFEDQYEPRVYLKKELQTRTENWHDFFNALIWLRFPNTKKMLNSIHFNTASSREIGTNRSTLENRITQFDECGAVIITSNTKLLELIRNHQWKKLFIEHRDSFSSEIECVVFGHAIFEKALTPYIGMTCHCILLEDNRLLKEVQEANYTNLDLYLTKQWQQSISSNPQRFNAFPILGVPGYWPEQSTDFYDNEQYFRSK